MLSETDFRWHDDSSPHDLIKSMPTRSLTGKLLGRGGTGGKGPGQHTAWGGMFLTPAGPRPHSPPLCLHLPLPPSPL